MARTLQKRIKFSKGQIVPELVERTDLELYDSSAQDMKNVVSTVYGGIRTRRGTKKIDRLYRYSSSEVSEATVVSALSATPENLQATGVDFVTTAIVDNKTIFELDYGEDVSGTFHIRGIKFDFKEPVVLMDQIQKQNGWYYANRPLTISNSGVGLTIQDTGYSPNQSDARTKSALGGFSSVQQYTGNGSTKPLFYLNVNSDGSIFMPNFPWNGNYSGGLVQTGSSTSKLVSETITFTRKSTPRVYPCLIETSTDGVIWQTLSTITVTETAQDFDATVDSVRYIRLIINSLDTIATTMSLHYVSFNKTQDEEDTGALLGNTKLLKLVYSATDYFVLVLSDETIQIYKNDVLVARVTASGLYDDYFEDLKWAAKDDTIIFVHEDMEPKILKRVSDTTWNYGTLSIDNIPYALFGNETVTAKTIGITPSATDGTVKITADSSVFNADYVGQYIDGNGGRVKVTSYVSATVVNGVTIIPFYTTDKITSWNYISGYEAVWSNLRGWPRTVLFAQQRLWFGGSKQKPATVWASRLGDYFNFKNAGNNANDAIDADLTTNDKIVNMIENRGVHIFTTGQEITVRENSYTPDDFTVTINSNNGSLGKVAPVCFEGVTAFIEKNGKSLLTYLYNDSVAAYETSNISMFTKLISNPVDLDAEVNSSKDKGNFLYMVLSDGSMLVDCISLSENIQSISKFVTDGKISDVLATPNETYIIVKREQYNYLEKITDTQTDLTVTYPAYQTNVSVLTDLEGKEVWVYDDKEVYGKYIVSGGVVTLPSVLDKDVYIGQAFDYRLESNPISINGQTYSIKKRITKATLVCKDTKRLSFNQQVGKYEDVYKFYNCTKYDNDVRFVVSGEFYPINVMSVTLDINYEG